MRADKSEICDNHKIVLHYIKEQWGHLGQASVRKIFQYVEEVLEDPTFQEDPVSFIESWDKERGETEELRVPEDPAREVVRKCVASQDEEGPSPRRQTLPKPKKTNKRTYVVTGPIDMKWIHALKQVVPGLEWRKDVIETNPPQIEFIFTVPLKSRSQFMNAVKQWGDKAHLQSPLSPRKERKVIDLTRGEVIDLT